MRRMRFIVGLGIASFLTILMIFSPIKAQENTKNFGVQGQGIDRCLSFSQSCGEPAANYFCQQQGYSHAISYQTRSVPTTRVMGTGQICTVGVNSGVCDEFTNIVCAQEQPTTQEATQNFVLQGRGVDWCFTFSQANETCGYPTASYFCQQQGYSHAISYQTRPVPTTRLMGSGEMCAVGVNFGQCDEFTNIVCAQGKQANNSSSSSTASSSIPQEMVNAHNQWRSKLGLPPLRWSDEVANYAQQWANQLASTGAFEHRTEHRYGENLFMASGRQFSPTEVVNEWGSEVAYYDYATNSCRPGEMCGHYTQVVWRDTTEVGCAVARSGNREVWVCNYNPPGNYIGQKPY